MREVVKLKIGDRVNVWKNEQIIDTGTLVDYCENTHKAVLQHLNGTLTLEDPQNLRPTKRNSVEVMIVEDGDVLYTKKELDRAFLKLTDAVYLDNWFTNKGAAKRLKFKDLIDFSTDNRVTIEILKDLIRK